MYRPGAHLIVMRNLVLLYVNIAVGIGAGVPHSKVSERVVI